MPPFEQQPIKPNGHHAVDKQYYLNYLKTKFPLPKQPQTASAIDLVSSLKERNFLVECVYENLIDDFASTLEQMSKLSDKS